MTTQVRGRRRWTGGPEPRDVRKRPGDRFSLSLRREHSPADPRRLPLKPAPGPRPPSSEGLSTGFKPAARGSLVRQPWETWVTAAPSRRRGHTKGGLGRSLATSGSRTCTFNTY